MDSSLPRHLERSTGADITTPGHNFRAQAPSSGLEMRNKGTMAELRFSAVSRVSTLIGSATDLEASAASAEQRRSPSRRSTDLLERGLALEPRVLGTLGNIGAFGGWTCAANRGRSRGGDAEGLPSLLPNVPSCPASGAAQEALPSVRGDCGALKHRRSSTPAASGWAWSCSPSPFMWATIRRSATES